MLNHEHESHLLACLSPSLGSSLTAKLSPPVPQTLYSLSITNCVAPPRPTPPLFSLCPALIALCSNIGWKHSLSLFRRDERGHGERRRKGRKRKTNKREAAVQPETEWKESTAYLDKPPSLCRVCVCARVCALRPAERHSLIKTLLDDRGRRLTDRQPLFSPASLSGIMELGV